MPVNPETSSRERAIGEALKALYLAADRLISRGGVKMPTEAEREAYRKAHGRAWSILYKMGLLGE